MSGTVMHSSDGFTQRVKLLTGKDGWPIALGDWRYGEDGKHWYIAGIGETYVWGERAGGKGQKRLRPEWLTKEKPDSWDAVRDDMEAASSRVLRGETSPEVCVLAMRDLVRRCERLAGVD